ncbi:Pentatricopeptide repeat-containing protein [Ananas comosus]|uniref:Pentatricopeptide repeat-containing protein n=1 Tax=Ananas comosus TaxID=4615 RepID=A0A199UGK8_ANACO|nr:Pentatricopeptide repeat-containing protein [Ananas comosus]
MPKRDVVLFTAMICGLVQNGFGDRALDCFFEMKEGKIEPTMITLTSVLSACSQLRKLAWGKILHGFLLRRGFADDADVILQTALLDMYGKCGSAAYAERVFDQMPERNLVSWNSVIGTCVSNGLFEGALQLLHDMVFEEDADKECGNLDYIDFGRNALDMFTQMKESGINPDGIAFLHGGLVDDGQKLFDSMQIDYSVAPEMTHFVCMVDLYGRAGFLEEAHRFIKTMPVEPSKLVWSALLSSCRTHKKVALGEYAATKAIELDRYDTGWWADLSKVRSLMKELGLRPITAFSWVEVKRKIYKFTVGDRMKESSKDIYDFLESLSLKMKRAGLFPHTSNRKRRVIYAGIRRNWH